MKILAFPKDSGNPYQELLYREMRLQGDTVSYLSTLTPSATINALIFLPRVMFWRMRGYAIFHLHWKYGFMLEANMIGQTKFFRYVVYWNYLMCLKGIKLLGYRLVWTAHNVIPHEPLFIDDVSATRQLVVQADLVICHSRATLEELKRIGAEPKRFAIIPHGSYVGVYPNTIDRETARKTLGLGPKEFVYLYLGQIRPYKGVEDLLTAYEKVKNKNSKLLIAGQCRDEGLRGILEDARSENIIWFDTFINEADMQLYFNAADVVVLPFKKITTSGSALLALSFGKAIILPSIGDLAYLPDDAVYKYLPGTGNLEAKLREVMNHSEELRKKSIAARLYAEKLEWPIIAKQTHDIFKELIER